MTSSFPWETLVLALPLAACGSRVHSVAGGQGFADAGPEAQGAAEAGAAAQSAGEAGAPINASPCPVTFEDPGAICDANGRCPVTIAARADCPFTKWDLSIAAGAGDRGYVAFSSDDDVHPSLLTIDPAGGTGGTTDVPPGAQLVASASGSLSIFSTTGVAPNPLSYVTRASDGSPWTTEAVSGHVEGVSAASFGDRTPVVAFNDSSPGSFFLATRNEAGSWAITQLAPVAVIGNLLLPNFGVALDGAGHTYVSYVRGSANGTPELAYHVDGGPAHAAPIAWIPAGGYPLPIAVPGALGAPLVAMTQPDAIHVLVPNGAGYDDTPLASSGALAPTGCPNVVGFCGQGKTCACSPEVWCTEKGNGALSQPAVARTDDGAVWVAYVRETIDEDEHIYATCGEPGCTCELSTVTSRTTTELVLARVGPTGGKPEIRWTSQATTDLGGGQIAMVAKGTRLYVVTAAVDPVRYWVVETGGI